ncbi:hypothetical protein RRG08_007155 [Elysia crispata]|uniref:Uncharacterized protein n=1 Tax=Elysia crispata TaxID=231223 RepID=A0AAE1E9C1_9GAST|nr:hypothetical protein RRG08_007155 [Elysia crispata]
MHAGKGRVYTVTPDSCGAFGFSPPVKPNLGLGIYLWGYRSYVDILDWGSLWGYRDASLLWLRDLFIRVVEISCLAVLEFCLSELEEILPLGLLVEVSQFSKIGNLSIRGIEASLLLQISDLSVPVIEISGATP